MGPSAPVVPLPERSRLANALSERRFVTLVELSPPHGFVSDALVEQACALQRRGVDAVLIAEDARGGRMSALALAVLIQQRASIEAVLQYACRDRNLLGMQSDLLGAHAMGLRNLVLVTGNDRPLGDYPDATVVYDVDSIGLTNVVRRLNEGLDVGGQAIGSPTGFHIGVHLNPGAEDLEHEIRRFEYKVAAGAEFAVTGPVFDKETFDRLQSRIAHLDVPLIVGLRPLDSLRNAEFMANEVPGIRVPDHVLERMRAAPDAEAAAAEGVAIARELAAALKPAVQGVHISVPAGRVDAALDVLAALR
jgi:homocysteine S-methyltransferase